jgi:putative acetyltransferase
LLTEISHEFAVLRVEVNEQNPRARAFYAARGFGQVGRTEIDGEGRPFPLLILRREDAAAGR